MTSFSLVTWASAIVAVLATSQSPALLSDIHQPNQGGPQKIVGSSFGVPGKDASFDYVVRLLYMDSMREGVNSNFPRYLVEVQQA